jgi:hypothetical protein
VFHTTDDTADGAVEDAGEGGGSAESMCVVPEGLGDIEESDSMIRATVRVVTTAGAVQAEVDTATQSVWVDAQWYRDNIGEPGPDDRKARAADKQPLSVSGQGRITFSWWIRVFRDRRVRPMKNMETPIIIGLRLQREFGLVLDVGRICGSFIAAGNIFQGRLNVTEEPFDDGERVHGVIEDADLDECIRNMDLQEFLSDPAAQEALRAVVWLHRGVFKGLGLVKGVKHCIAIKEGAKPVLMPQRKRSPAEVVAEKAIVLKLVATGVLAPCMSDSAANNVFVPKNDHGLRYIDDFRGVNAQTIRDRFPAEDPRQHINWLAQKKFYSCLDLKDTYHQVVLAPEIRKWAAVRKFVGLFQYASMS